jgi:hypothetical protein
MLARVRQIQVGETQSGRQNNVDRFGQTAARMENAPLQSGAAVDRI